MSLGEELHELPADVGTRLLVPAELAVLDAITPEGAVDAVIVLAVVLSLGGVRNDCFAKS